MSSSSSASLSSLLLLNVCITKYIYNISVCIDNKVMKKQRQRNMKKKIREIFEKNYLFYLFHIFFSIMYFMFTCFYVMRIFKLNDKQREKFYNALVATIAITTYNNNGYEIETLLTENVI